MKKFVFFIVFSCLFFGSVLSQQSTQFSQWVFNPISYNPALSGIKKCPEFKTMSRVQWLGFSGAPISNVITYSVQLHTKQKQLLSPRHGIGIKFENDMIGPFVSNGLNFSYGSHFNFTPETRLSFGISLGVKQVIFSNASLTTLLPDPANSKASTYYAPVVSFGSWWNGKNYYLSTSFQQMSIPQWKNVGVDSRDRLHWTFSGGYRWSTSDNITIIPNVLIKKTIHSPLAMDFMTYVDYATKFKIGVGFRNKESMIGLFQVKIKDEIFVGYSVDIITSKLNTSTLFSHELTLSYSSCPTKDLGRLSCPLF